MKCPSCNKFAGLDMDEPEIESEDFNAEEGTFIATVRILRRSSCCGEEMKEARLEFEGQVPDEILQAHKEGEESESTEPGREAHELEAEFSADSLEEGGGRYAKSYFGANLEVTIRCRCQAEAVHVVTLSEKVAASEMEEMC
jgi:hypothetical protein